MALLDEPLLDEFPELFELPPAPAAWAYPNGSANAKVRAAAIRNRCEFVIAILLGILMAGMLWLECCDLLPE